MAGENNIYKCVGKRGQNFIGWDNVTKQANFVLKCMDGMQTL